MDNRSCSRRSLWCIAFYWPVDLLAQQPSFEIVLLQHYHQSASSRRLYMKSKAFVIWRPVPWQNRVLPCISQHHESNIRQVQPSPSHSLYLSTQSMSPRSAPTHIRPPASRFPFIRLMAYLNVNVPPSQH